MEFNIFKYMDYREIIRRSAKRKRISFKSLATSSRIHSSYFSRVMTGKADFSPEQLYLIGSDLAFSEAEMEYLLLLGEFSSTGNAQHRAFLKQKIQKISEKHQKVISQLKEVDADFSVDQKLQYYQEAVTALIHMYLTIEKYRQRPQLICSKVNVDEHKLGIEMDKLERLGIIGRDDGDVEVLKYNVHLDETDPLIPLVHINWRLDAISYVSERRKKPTDFHMSAQFSTDEESKNQIRDLFKKFVVEAQKISSQKKTNEEVFRIAFDLY